MELDRLLQDEQSLKKLMEPDETSPEDLEGNGEDSIEQDAQDDPNNQTAMNPLGGFNSTEELLQAYQTLDELLQEKVREVQQLTDLLDSFDRHTRAAVKVHQNGSFQTRIREMYELDPIRAMEMMIKQYQEDTLNDYDAKEQDRFRRQQDLMSFMDELLSHPSFSGLKQHENELAFLIHEHGVSPRIAAEIIRNVEERSGAASTRRSDAARAVRNRSMVESPGEVGEPLDTDEEFDRVLKKAKSLDEMFAGLRKLKL